MSATAIVTGGAGGLGRAVGAALARRQAAVALIDVDGERVERAASELGGRDGRLIGITADITSKTDIESAWEVASHTLGPVDIVVNNAGFWRPRSLAEIDEEHWGTSLAVNLTGPFLLSRHAALRWMEEERSGSIVNVSSTAAVRSGSIGGAFDYAAGKAGLLGLTTQLAVALGPFGIRTNAVIPGSFRSPMNAERLSIPGEEERSSAAIPLRRIGEPEEIASLVEFLALDGTYVNGAIIPCDGGVIATM